MTVKPVFYGENYGFFFSDDISQISLGENNVYLFLSLWNNRECRHKNIILNVFNYILILKSKSDLI